MFIIYLLRIFALPESNARGNFLRLKFSHFEGSIIPQITLLYVTNCFEGLFTLTLPTSENTSEFVIITFATFEYQALNFFPQKKSYF